MQSFVVLVFACLEWAFCGALVGIGRQFMNMDATLIVHAIGAPIGAAALSWIYFRNFGYTRPLTTAVIFVAVALALDVVIVALFIEQSFDMFRSLLGVWIPLALILAATWATGALAARQASHNDQRRRS